MAFLGHVIWTRDIPLSLQRQLASALAGTTHDVTAALGAVPAPALFANGRNLNTKKGGFLKPARMQPRAYLFISDSADTLGATAHSADLRVACYRAGVYQGVVAYYPLSVSTTLGTAITASNKGGYVAVTPASMTGIVPGMWLGIDQGAAGYERVMVASTTSTTFTAYFANTHLTSATVQSVLVQYQATPFVLADALPAAGTTGVNAVGGAGAVIVQLANPYGVHVGDSLVCDTGGSKETVKVTAVTTVDTTSGTAVGAPGAVAITPASMAGIVVGTPLVCDTGGSQETLVVASVTSTTFTCTFANTHSSGFLIRSDNFTATFANAHSASFAITSALTSGALANGTPFEMQEGDVLVYSRVSSDLTGLATPAGTLQIDWKPSELKVA